MSNDLKTQGKKERRTTWLDLTQKCIYVILGAAALITFMNPDLKQYGLLFGIILAVVILFFEDRTHTKEDILNIKDDLKMLHEKISNKDKRKGTSYMEIVLFILMLLFLFWMINQTV